MADLGNFDAETEEPSQDFSAIPDGRYPVMLTESEEVKNSSSEGSHLKLTFQVIDGPYKGRLLWHRLNLKNQSQQAVQIARGQLSSICRAVNVLKPRDSSELHNLPLEVRVEQREYDGKTYNDIKAFYPREGSAPAKQTHTASPKPSGGGAAPWKKSG